MEPQIISVRCPICYKLWDILYDEHDGPPPIEEKCSSCVRDENYVANQFMMPSQVDMKPGDC